MFASVFTRLQTYLFFCARSIVKRFPRLSVVSVSQSHEKEMEENVGKVV